MNELLRAWNDAGVRYVLAGGQAMRLMVTTPSPVQSQRIRLDASLRIQCLCHPIGKPPESTSVLKVST